MTRPRVSPDKRQRIAQACESCKRRKQKCNGLQPCDTCSKRGLLCNFGVSTSVFSSDNQPLPGKRQKLDHITSTQQHLSSSSATPSSLIRMNTSSESSFHTPQDPNQFIKDSPCLTPCMSQYTTPSHTSNYIQPPIQSRAIAGNHSDTVSGASKDGSVHDEEAVVYDSARMLQDPTGRLLYVGDSATLSYLQLIRMIVESIDGPSPFTMDPKRHRIVENVSVMPQSIRNTHLLPDKVTALILVEAFFTNTSGLVKVFSRGPFMDTLNACYSDPLHVDSSWLCLLYLTFSIGLVLATPPPGSQEDTIIRGLRVDPINRAELFYSSAKGLCDPTTGFEDADFWSIQALLLMTLYMLCVSKRNAAYAYCGMAVRSGFALGLHRDETLVIFGEEEQEIRQCLWRSLFVLDVFLATSLGRPTSISKEDSPKETLKAGTPKPLAGSLYAADSNIFGDVGLDASVRICQVAGIILKEVYSKRKISTKIAHELAIRCRSWNKTLHSSLQWRHMSQVSGVNPSHRTAILHINLLYCHTIILLTRPFFLFLLSKILRNGSGSNKGSQYGTRMEKFSEVCVVSSCRSIILVQTALDGNFLSRRNPFVLYFLFAAALIVLSNECCKLCESRIAESCIVSSISIMAYCAEADPLAQRLLFILNSFRDVVNRQKDTTRGYFMISSLDDTNSSFFSSGPNLDLSSENTIGPMPAIHPPFESSVVEHIVRDMGDVPNAVEKDSRPSDISPLDSQSNRLSSQDATDSTGEGEIDFESFWNLNNMAGIGAKQSVFIAAQPRTGKVLAPTTTTEFSANNLQGIIDGPVPLFEMSDLGSL